MAVAGGEDEVRRGRFGGEKVAVKRERGPADGSDERGKRSGGIGRRRRRTGGRGGRRRKRDGGDELEGTGVNYRNGGTGSEGEEAGRA